MTILIFIMIAFCQSLNDIGNVVGGKNTSNIKDELLVYSFPATGSFNGKICQAPVSKNWKTDAGYFRQTANDTATKCTPGFFCPENTFQPVYCCPGFFCSTPATIEICPQGKYCPIGSISGQNCWGLAECDEGTVMPVRYGTLGIIFGFLVVIAFGFHIKSRIDKATAIQNDRKIEKVHENVLNAIDIPKSPSKLHDKSFDIEFNKLEFTLPDGTCIMKNVSGKFQSGRMTAIMGPSGAGKSTLFSLLTGRLKRSSGTLMLNGVEDELSKYKKLVGVVPQDDIMLKELNVKSILSHSANMRLPLELTKQAKSKQVLETIEFLGLGNVINSDIGNEEKRGISGGQRKRVNIGMEIVADPAILFLDEPTSGLDSSTSLELCRILYRLARENRMTIAAVIHSPSPQTFMEFDNVLFLCKGGLVAYYGPTTDVLKYFTSLGFERGTDISPADFAMDIISGRIPCSWDCHFDPSDLAHYWECHKNGSAFGKQVRKIFNSRSLGRLLDNVHVITYRMKIAQSLVALASDVKEWIVDVFEELVDTILAMHRFITFAKHPVRNTPNSLVCCLLLLERAFKQQFKSARIFIMDSVIHFIAGLVISIAIQQFTYYGPQPKEVCAIAPVMLYFACNFPIDYLPQAAMLATIGVFFAGQATATNTFGSEKTVFWRDSSSGMPTTSYFLAKFIADIPRMVIASFFYTFALTMFIDFRSTFADLFLIYAALYYVAFTFGYFISIVFNKASVPLVTAANAMIQGFLLGGVSPDLNEVYNAGPNSIITPFRWLWEISGPRWAVEAYYLKETQARPWIELQPDSVVPIAHGYGKNTYSECLKSLVKIGSMWVLFSLLALKLTKRRKQK